MSDPNISVPISCGELIDKFSILDIKIGRIKDAIRLKEVKKEHDLLFPLVQDIISKYDYHYRCLIFVNEKIWDLTDIVKSGKKDGLFEVFEETFKYNEFRFRIKSKFNKLLDSNIKEQKSYNSKSIYLTGEGDYFSSDPAEEKIRYLALEYDLVYPIVKKEFFDLARKKYRDDPHITIVLGENSSSVSSKNPNVVVMPLTGCKPNHEFTVRENNPNYVSGGRFGDFIHVLYTARCKYLETGRKANIYITNDTKFGNNPFTTDIATTYREIYPIIVMQDYISTFEIYSDDIKVNCNLNDFRKAISQGMMLWLKLLAKCFNHDLVLEPWITIPTKLDKYKDVVFIHRSTVMFRWVDSFMPYIEKLLASNKIMFLTSKQDEYDAFPLKDKIPLEKVDTLEEMYIAINSCKFFIGNQSSPLAMAFSLFKPVLCELGCSDKYMYLGIESCYPSAFWMSDDGSHLEGIEKYLTFPLPEMKYYGEDNIDEKIQSYFPVSHKGFCIDVGMGKPITNSNTYHFEQLGWECLCIEANKSLCSYAKGIRKNVENYACGEYNIDNYKFKICATDSGSGRDETLISSLKIDERLLGEGKSFREVPVNVRRLDFILEGQKKKIDFISIDTQGTELDVLKGFDLTKWKPKILVIGNIFSEPFVAEYLAPLGYKKIKTIGVNEIFIFDLGLSDLSEEE